MLAPLIETNTIVSDRTDAYFHAGTEIFLVDGVNWPCMMGMFGNRENPWPYVKVVKHASVLNKMDAVITDSGDHLCCDTNPGQGLLERLGANPKRLIDLNLSGFERAGDAGYDPHADICLVNLFDYYDMGFAPTSSAQPDGYGGGAEYVKKSADDLALAQLRTENVYTLNAIRDFGRIHSRRLRSSRWILPAVVEIINHSVLRGYRPVVNFDDEDHSLEIEARLDIDQLLVLHVHGSGIVEGQIYSKSFKTKSISQTKASDFLDWLVSQDGQDT